MNLKKILAQFNILGQCRQYGVSLWQCPQFLFLIMGIIIITATLTIYAVGNNYIEDPGIVALVVLLVTVVLFIIAFIITRSFERLAEASRMKTEFINIVTHQLRSPLTNLKWAIDFLLADELKISQEKKMEYFKILKENTFQMGELIDNLLFVSRIEQKKLPFKKEEISLEDLIKKLTKECQPFLQATDIELTCQVQKDLPKIFTNPSQIKLVLDNLLNNAIRYSKKKGKVEIQAVKENKNLKFQIKDNGVGIPKEDQKYIFQKFFRAANAFRYQTQGSGLGLYITKLIVENLGGKIGFQSEEDKGSTFWFTIPIFTK
jgi:signal transduction histidine kinase